MKKKNNQGFLPASPYIAWSSLFIVIPLLIVVFFAFTIKSGDTYKFSLENFQRLLDPNYLKVFGRSLLLAAEATLGCLILGYPVAYLISKMREGKRNILIIPAIAMNIPTFPSSNIEKPSNPASNIIPCTTRLVEVPINVQIPPRIVT